MKIIILFYFFILIFGKQIIFVNYIVVFIDFPDFQSKKCQNVMIRVVDQVAGLLGRGESLHPANLSTVTIYIYKYFVQW